MNYLDNAATTLPKPPRVIQAVREAMESMASPGRGGHEAAMRAAETVFRCREAAAEMFHVSAPENVVFTLNATHALNLALHTMVHRGTRVLISGFEHNAVTRPLHALGARIRIAGRRVFDHADTLQSFEREICGAELVVCTHVSNVFGYVLPIQEIAQLCQKHGVPLVVDASQSAGILPIDMQQLGAAFLAMPGHKALFGPQGTGMLLCGAPVKPLLYGGSGSDSIMQQMPSYLPDRLEAGTHNVCGIAGLLAGMETVRALGTDTIAEHERELVQLMIRELEDSDLVLFAGEGEIQCGVLSLLSDRMDCESLAAALAERGICVRSGLHCAPTAHESAGTLDSGTVRFSFSPYVTASQVKAACGALREILETGETEIS